MSPARPYAPFLFAALLALAAPGARAQLISPGPLTSAHANLEGIRNCTSCHQLGQRGISPQKCLDCHTPLRDRIAAGRGLHADLSRQCASCHRDHAGRSYDAVRFNTRGFDHSRTGFRLAGEHAGAACRSCHTPAHVTDAAVRRFVGGRIGQTYLGLGNTCETCHADENPHGRQFAGQTCRSCHTPDGWNGARADFDHASTGFRLVGAHARTSCASCHGDGGQFTGLSEACASCHADDNPHGAQFAGQSCASCHGNESFGSAPNFSHARTDFPLTGRHVDVSCSSCHAGSGGNRQFTGIAHGSCATCHEDAHDGAMGGDCQTCHTTAGWTRMAGGFDASRFDHEEHTGFALVGAHGALGCTSCHARPARNDDAIRIQFTGGGDGSFPAVAHEACGDCHRDPHDGAFADALGGSDCASCHEQTSFRPARFDLARHAQTDFPLEGAHVAVPCSACHRRPGHDEPVFEVGTACETCHAEDNPHGREFADADGTTDCASCHATTAWSLAEFDHSETDFPLTGAHQLVECTSCHAPTTGADGRTQRRFTGLRTECATCHEDDSPHRDQFVGQACETCHDTAAFTVARFDHAETRFPLDGAHEGVPCASCHRPETAPDGTAFIRFKPLGTACADCHSG